jgi:hypothetical protein
MTKLRQMSAFSPPLAGLAYLVGYVFLDIVADQQFPDSLGISAWHPSVGLSFLLVVFYGSRMLPLVFLAPFAAELISRGDVFLAALEAMTVGGGYALAATLLVRPE